ncbi:MAG TPA: T9SS type A sorting domain-containing protein [Bacteroidetes bacterium]|nr:T9SS type A sorting domain-containing protein [Bacteroidota bacterium]
MREFVQHFAALCFVLFLLIMFPFQGNAQFKNYFDPDTNLVNNPNLYECTTLIETGIPGQEIAIGGAISGRDSLNVNRQTAYLMQVGYNGVPKKLNLFEDPASFLIYGPRLYSLCFDGINHFYLALGSNDNQLVLKTRVDGSLIWATALNHHATYGIAMEGDSVIAMGQDESVQGVHDYALTKMDSNGTTSPGMMFGTVGFDQPEKMIVTPDGYVMAGFTFAAGLFNPMIIKSDKSYNKLWSYIVSAPGKDMSCDDISAAMDGSGYVATGKVTTLGGGPDSLFVLKLDTVGTLMWCNFYGVNTADKLNSNGIATDPQGRGYLVCGAYAFTGVYRQPFVFRVDKNGNPVWIRAYGIRDTLYDEVMQDIIIRENGSFFYSIAQSEKIDTNFTITKRIFMVKASVETGEIPCDSAMSFGMQPAFTTPGGGTHTEAYYVDKAYSFVGIPASVDYEIACSVYVSVPEPALFPNFFSFVNPATDELILDYSMELGRGAINLMDLQGRVLRQYNLQEGQHRERHSLQGISAGMYFLVGQGETWKIPVKRLLITHH